MIRFLVTLLFVSKLWAAQDVELTIPSAVEVSPRSEISAYDIVEAKNLNDDIADELKQIKINQLRLTKGELAKLFRSVPAKFVLPTELKIIQSKNNVSRMELERIVKNKILSECKECDIQVRIASVPANMDKDWEVDLNIDLNKNSAMIPIVAIKNSDLKGWVVAEVKKYQKVPVLNRAVKMGEVLSEDMFTLEKRQVLNSNIIKSIEAASGMQAARFLNAGQQLTAIDLKREQVLKRGQMVKAVVGENGFEVAISAEAQEAGTIGDVVKVKNMDSAKVFAAKIIDRGLVRIE